MLSPLTMFCCGCQVKTGAYAVMFLHLAWCASVVFAAVMNVAFRTPTFAAAWTLPGQMFHAGFALVGVALISSGIFGLMSRSEVNVRLYLYYMLVASVIWAIDLVRILLLKDQCTSDGQGASDIFRSFADTFGEAFLCGTFQIACYFLVSILAWLQVYCLWTVWTVCEELREGHLAPELAELLPSKADLIQKVRMSGDGPYTDIVGLAHARVPGPYPSPNGYDAISTTGMPAQPTIFGGSRHDYPPA
eukprot:TRINITY_DN47434_c0_g1_i1.p1 TRINITY_DN47434_c0_g1~~TRINITY_DN47434_c0_g1_i1.p1  ORF type:complete len:247 (+),score=37.00 TRINITY_DN47434_c0_g1_i1:94-834(+)